MVSPERQIFKCFGCGKGGDIFGFLMEKEGLDFKEALDLLAKKAGIVLQRRNDTKKDSRDRLFEINLKAQEFFQHILNKHIFGKKALEYLHERSLKDETIAAFGIGYAPNSWESLTKFLLKRGFKINELINVGLTVSSKSSGYDRFRGRITFPLIDNKDRIIGFSGRVLDNTGGPKYINTPETLVFNKSEFLYGINRAKSEIKIKNLAILVEGEMDVILSFQAGIKNVVASKGTALTLGQIELLKKYTENISLCFDTDLAGDSASRRGIEMADAAGLNIKVLQFSGGKDPAEIIKTDPDIWEKAVEMTIPIYDYYLDSVSKRFNPNDPAGLKQIAAELMPIWAKISDNLVREHYIQKLATFLKTDEVLIRKEIEKSGKGIKPQTVLASQKDDLIPLSSRRVLLEQYLISLLLHIPKEYIFVPTFDERLFTQEVLSQIYVLLVLYLDSISFKGRQFNINEFLKNVPKELSEEIDKLYLMDLDEKLQNKDYWQKEVDKVISELKKALIKSSLEKLSFEIRNAEGFGKIEAVELLNKRFRDLSVKLKNL
ncbi:MAG: DNA primase [Microgenomates group bacterium Gr01-1014_93]|nr:MAG: DNA primase [Microgenomates group bacterium Gr01-1014_93]